MSRKYGEEARRERAARAARATRKRKLVRAAVALGVAAVLATGVGYAYLAGGSTAQAETVAAGDIVTDRPFHAIHEMKKGPRIPFLPASEPQPRIEAPTTVHDFGTLGPKDVVIYTFTVHNTGEAPLTISRAFTTCGCTTADVSARVIPPGKAATVKLKFDAGFHDVRGQSVKRGIVFESNDRKRWKTTVWTKARIRNG